MDQCQPRPNCQTQPLWVQGIRIVPNGHNLAGYAIGALRLAIFKFTLTGPVTYTKFWTGFDYNYIGIYSNFKMHLHLWNPALFQTYPLSWTAPVLKNTKYLSEAIYVPSVEKEYKRTTVRWNFNHLNFFQPMIKQQTSWKFKAVMFSGWRKCIWSKFRRIVVRSYAGVTEGT